jgi:hypothetical protein
MNRLLLVSDANVESVTFIQLQEIILSVKEPLDIEWLPFLLENLPIIRQETLYQLNYHDLPLDIAILSCSPVQHGIMTEHTRIIVTHEWPNHLDAPIVPWNDAVNDILNEPIMFKSMERILEPDKISCKVQELASRPCLQLPENADESCILLLDPSLLLHLGLGSGSQVIVTYEDRKRAAWAFGMDQPR